MNFLKSVRKNIRENAALLVLLLLIVAFFWTFSKNHSYLSVYNIGYILNAMAVSAPLAVGGGIIIIFGDVDLAPGYIGTAAGTMMTALLTKAGLLLLQPHSFMTRCFTLPDLFAGKMHALVSRTWKNRVKGRDWYDFEWYVRHNVPLDFTHLAERCRQFNNEEITPELFKEKLIERLSTADIKQVKADVLPFVRNPKELDIWSNDYFVQLAEMVRME